MRCDVNSNAHSDSTTLTYNAHIRLTLIILVILTAMSYIDAAQAVHRWLVKEKEAPPATNEKSNKGLFALVIGLIILVVVIIIICVFIYFGSKVVEPEAQSSTGDVVVVEVFIDEHGNRIDPSLVVD